MAVSGTLVRVYIGCVACSLATFAIAGAFRADAPGSRSTWVTVALSLLIAAPITWLVSRHLRLRLRALRRVAERLAAGELKQRVIDHQSDEAGRLGNAFNAMADQLEERISALHAERDKLDSIISGMAEGLIATDREERVVHINAAAVEILNVEAKEAFGRPLWEITRFPKLQEVLELAMHGNADTRLEITLPGPRNDRVVELRATKLLAGDGELNGAIVALNDISHIRHLEGMRRNFVSNVSHELKTPLMAIQGIAETLIDDPSMDCDTRIRFLERLRNQGDRLASLVHDLLELSRVESIPDTQDREIVDLRHTIRLAVEESKPYADDKHITLTYDECATPLWVRGDTEMLRQLADNLLHNAVQYTHADGDIHVSSSSEASGVVFEVRDSGIGIDPKHLDRIFERFYRVEKARSRALGGTGLGLSIVKHVALAHDGKVDVESEPGVGTRFRVTLPLSAPSGDDY